MKSLFSLALIIGTCCTQANEQTFTLARQLLEEQEYALSAVEFRRFSMETENPAKQSASYLFAGYAYLRDNNGTTASEMLDHAEDAGLESENEHILLSAETARLQHDPDTALYFYETLGDSGDAAYQTFAHRRTAAIHLGRGDFEAARSQLEQSPSDETQRLDVLDAFVNGSNKSPAIGGLLGFIPGGGYWYSGEVANGFRSLILNSLFMFGMYQTADNEQWGAFAIITFFEITWYSGSIYGGIDAAQRYNQNRLDTALQGIEGNLSYQPDPEIVVPLFKLNVHF